MSAKTLKPFLMIFAVVVFSGCTTYEQVLVPVPIPCEVKEPVCDHTKETDTELMTEARLCINRLQEALRVCIN